MLVANIRAPRRRPGVSSLQLAAHLHQQQEARTMEDIWERVLVPLTQHVYCHNILHLSHKKEYSLKDTQFSKARGSPSSWNPFSECCRKHWWQRQGAQAAGPTRRAHGPPGTMLLAGNLRRAGALGRRAQASSSAPGHGGKDGNQQGRPAASSATPRCGAVCKVSNNWF